MTGDNQVEGRFIQGYRNTFTAIPWDMFFRPSLLTRRPLPGCQTARITGSVDEEIFCDEYGRVKVELRQDRWELGSDKSSCWLRAASSWTGECFGAMTISRVGMEVVASLLEGDPDRPLITGVVPNKTTPVPYALPVNKSRTALRSRSTLDSSGYNELSIEDRAGQEKILLRAQRDTEQPIPNDSYTSIGNDCHERTSRDSRNLVENGRFEQVNMNSSGLIKGDKLHTTQGERHTRIGGNKLPSISGAGSTAVDGTWVVQAGSQARVTVTNVLADAGVNLILKTGRQHIVINSAEIFSSVPIVQGGVLMAGIVPQQALQALAEAAQTVIVNSLPLVAAAR